MTKKKRVIVSLSEEAYKTLNDLMGITLNINGNKYAINTKSKAIETLLNEIQRKTENDQSKK